MRHSPDELPPLYGLTDPSSGLSLSENAEALITAGIRWIQVRAKGDPDNLLLAQLETIAAVLPAGVKLVINDRADLALAIQADGVHLGEEDIPAEAARRVAAGRPLMIGASTHSVESAILAASDPAVDYVAFGPLFESRTKNVRPPLGLDALREVRDAVQKPIVAIGGIEPRNISAVIAAGATSCAVIGALYAGGLITENVHRLLDAINSGE